MNNKKTQEKSVDVLLQEFQTVLDHVGYNISANDYDKLEITRPSRRTLLRRTGQSWSELKTISTHIPQNSTHKALLSQNQALQSRLARQQDITASILDTCRIELAKMKIPVVKVPPKEKQTSDQEFHAMVSDIHIGEYTDATWVQGLARYDVETYRKRSDKWLEKIMLFREQDKKSLGLNTFVQFYLGDIVTGESVYKGQAFSIDLNLVQQLFMALEVEAAKLRTLASIFPEVVLYCVLGNHGRLNKAEHPGKTNFDYIFYRMLQQVMIGQKNVHIYVSESPSMVVDRGKFTFLINHGDAAKSYMGTPYYGLERQFNKLHSLYGMIIDYELVGHHHVPSKLGDKIYINGSYPGGSDLSVNRMNVASLPSQKIFYFDDDEGINRESDLHLGDRIVLPLDEEGIYTPHDLRENEA